jgi:hypothetical protein
MRDSREVLAVCDRVRAVRRPGFPSGSVLKLLDRGLVLVRWDGYVLETADSMQLTSRGELSGANLAGAPCPRLIHRIPERTLSRSFSVSTPTGGVSTAIATISRMPACRARSCSSFSVSSRSLGCICVTCRSAATR